LPSAGQFWLGGQLPEASVGLLKAHGDGGFDAFPCDASRRTRPWRRSSPSRSGSWRGTLMAAGALLTPAEEPWVPVLLDCEVTQPCPECRGS